MINKKILAASVAAICSFNASANLDLNSSTTALIYSSEAVTTNTKSIDANVVLNGTVNVGQNLAVTGGAGPLMRFALTNATFLAAVDATDFQLRAASLADGTPGTVSAADTITDVSAAKTGSSFVVVKLENTDATLTTEEIEFLIGGASGLLVADVTKPVTLTYSLYSTGDTTAALNGNGTPLHSVSLDIATFASGQNRAGSFRGVANTATVAKQFKEFAAQSAGAVEPINGAIAAGKVASLGRIELQAVAGTSNVLNAASAAVTPANVYTAASKATVTGDFSFGTWHMSSADTCATASATANALVIDAAKTSATVLALDYVAGQSLCVTVDGVAVVDRNPDGYKVTLTENDLLAGTIGSIVYDTTNITVPYITSFSGYNQRVYILNNGSSDAKYSTTFQTEDGTTATAGTMATGTVPAKTLLVIKAVDMVTFEGTTRGAAVIEIEASTSAVESTTQTVNLSDGSTDTVTLAVSGS